MPQPLETLIFVHRLTASETAAIFAHDAVFPASGLKSRLLKAIEEACLDRLIRADGCLDLANRLYGAAVDEETLRAATSRAYYSAHHSLRAMALWQNKWDPDGHEESIKAFKTLLEDNNFHRRSGLSEDAVSRVIEARANRHVADYSPYKVQRDPPNTRWITITNDNWADAARFNLYLATELSQAATRFVGS